MRSSTRGLYAQLKDTHPGSKRRKTNPYPTRSSTQPSQHPYRPGCDCDTCRRRRNAEAAAAFARAGTSFRPGQGNSHHEEEEEEEEEEEGGGGEAWVQCDESSCRKWRRLPADFDVDKLPPKWYCFMHPDPMMAARGHRAPEDPGAWEEERAAAAEAMAAAAAARARPPPPSPAGVGASAGAAGEFAGRPGLHSQLRKTAVPYGVEVVAGGVQLGAPIPGSTAAILAAAQLAASAAKAAREREAAATASAVAASAVATAARRPAAAHDVVVLSDDEDDDAPPARAGPRPAPAPPPPAGGGHSGGAYPGATGGYHISGTLEGRDRFLELENLALARARRGPADGHRAPPPPTARRSAYEEAAALYSGGRGGAGAAPISYSVFAQPPQAPAPSPYHLAGQTGYHGPVGAPHGPAPPPPPPGGPPVGPAGPPGAAYASTSLDLNYTPYGSG